MFIIIRLLIVLLIFASLVFPQKVRVGGKSKTNAKIYSTASNTFSSDTFTESSDTALASHVGEIGATWNLHPSYSAAATVDAAIDRLYPTGTTSYYTSGVPSDADYCVSADYFHASTIAINIGIALRMNTSTDDMYIFRLNNGTSWEVIERLAGSNGVLGASSTNSLPSVGNSVNAKMCIAGTAITIYFNGVHDATLDRTGTNITAAGRAGFRAAGAASSSTGYHLDNFLATN